MIPRTEGSDIPRDRRKVDDQDVGGFHVAEVEDGGGRAEGSVHGTYSISIL